MLYERVVRITRERKSRFIGRRQPNARVCPPADRVVRRRFGRFEMYMAKEKEET